MGQSPTRRRWLRFSLRGLLIAVTLVAIWLGTNVYTVRQRKAALTLWRADPEVGVRGSVERLGEPVDSRPPAIRRWFADETIDMLVFPRDATDEELAAASKLFPEAKVFRSDYRIIDVPH